MRHRELLILGVISVVIALVLQTIVSIVGNDLLSYGVADFSYTSTGITLVLAVALAALIEESIRVLILFYYARLKGIPDNFWLYGSTFGFGFGLTEAMMASGSASSIWHYIGLLGIVVIHTLLGIFATYLIRYFKRLRIIATISLLVIVHSTYNLIILVVLPFFEGNIAL